MDITTLVKLLSTTDACFLLTDNQGKIIDASRGFSKLVGLPRSTLTGAMPPYAFATSDSPHYHRSISDRLSPNRRSARTEKWTFTHPLRGHFNVTLRFYSFANNDNPTRWLIKVVRASGHKRKLSRGQLRHSVATLILRRLNGVVYIFDHSLHKLAYIGSAYERVWGATRTSLYENNASFLDNINAVHRQEVMRCLEEQRQGKDTRACYQVTRPDGSFSWIDDRAYALTLEGRRYTIGLATDITEFKTTEDALHKKTHILETTLRAAHLYVWRYNYEANIAQWSQNLYDFLDLSHLTMDDSGTGATPAQLEAALLTRIYPDDLPYVTANLHILSSMRFRLQKTSGAVSYVELREELTHDSSNRCIGSLGIIHDITEAANRIQIESNVKRLEALQVFSSGLAHDLNNLLSIIMGNLREEYERRTKEDSDSIHAAMTAAERSAGLIRSLMQLGRQQDTNQFATIAIDDRLVSVVKLASAIVGPSHDLTLDCDANAALVYCDPVWLERSMINLITNSRDAMPSGGQIRISSKLIGSETLSAIAPQLGTTEAVQISVSDTGIGMTQDQIARAADPYYTTKRPGLGTGLGLTSVNAFAQHCKGQLVIKPAEPSGTTAIILLPTTEAMTRQQASRATNSADPETRTGVLNGASPRVLLVDDEALLLKLLSRMLSRNGFDVTAVSSPVAARKALHSSDYDILVTDLTLSDLEDGLSLAAWAVSTFERMRVILISGYLNPVATLPAGVSFLQKPFSNEDFLAALANNTAPHKDGDHAP